MDVESFSVLAVARLYTLVNFETFSVLIPTLFVYANTSTNILVGEIVHEMMGPISQ